MDRFTADIAMDFTYGMFFNTVFSLLPNMYVGIMDQDVNVALSYKYPALYGKGIRQELYNMERFWTYIFDAIYQSVIVYYGVVSFILEGASDPRGYVVDKQLAGTVIAIACVLIVNIYMGICTFSWTWITHLCVYASIASFFIFYFIYESDRESLAYGVGGIMFTEPSVYFGIVLIVVTALLPRIAIKAIQQYFFPRDTDVIQEIQKYQLESFDVEIAQPTEDDSFLNSSNTESLISIRRQRDKSELPQAVSEAGGLNTSSGLTVTDKQAAEKKSADVVSSAKERKQLETISESGQTSMKDKKLLNLSLSMDRKKKGGLFRSNSEGMNNGSDELNSSAGSMGLSRSGRGRRISNAAISGMFLQPISMVSRNVGDYVKSIPRKLRIGSLSGFGRSDKNLRATSLVFMGTHQELPNTGFAFSHETGMEDVITPMRSAPNDNADDLELKYLQMQKRISTGMDPAEYSPQPLSAPPVFPAFKLPDPNAQRVPSQKSILARQVLPGSILDRRLTKKPTKVTFSMPVTSEESFTMPGSTDLVLSESGEIREEMAVAKEKGKQKAEPQPEESPASPPPRDPSEPGPSST